MSILSLKSQDRHKYYGERKKEIKKPGKMVLLK